MGMSVAEFAERANRAATFTPQVGVGERPTVGVAGTFVTVYVEDGTLRVAVDLDDAEEWLSSSVPDGTVPMEITVQGTPVFSAR